MPKKYTSKKARATDSNSPLAQIESIKSEDYFEQYANLTIIMQNPMEFTLSFNRIGRKTGIRENDDLARTELGRIFLSPIQARALHEALGEQLNEYEKSLEQ